MARTALVSALGLMKRCKGAHSCTFSRLGIARTALVSTLGLMKRFVFGSFFSDRHSVPDTVSGGFSGFGADFGTDRSFPVRFLPWGRER